MKVRCWFAVGHGDRSQREAEDGWQLSPTSNAHKGPFYTKDPPFFFFLHLISTFVLVRGVIRASPLAFVHFVSGFNAKGLNCCSGNHCLCFLASHCARDIIKRLLRQYERFIFFSPSVRNEQRIGSGHLVVCVGGNGGTVCCFV